MHGYFPTFIAVAAFTCLAGPVSADQARLQYSLGAGATSAPITIPVRNSPVALFCSQTVVGDVGVGQAEVNLTSDNVLLFLGYSVQSTTIAGYIGVSIGQHIVYCDYNNKVDIEVAANDLLQIKNNTSGPVSGVIMFVY